ncbi:hypothetical protein [Clostridium gelidum]|uniref:hypothetical protein n=1 Tax=Clostridium gelidum TaxID=704125 RepID=UPI001CC3A62D|nr:hypothetical protein [Clostridium gelidum]
MLSSFSVIAISLQYEIFTQLTVNSEQLTVKEQSLLDFEKLNVLKKAESFFIKCLALNVNYVLMVVPMYIKKN